MFVIKQTKQSLMFNVNTTYNVEGAFKLSFSLLTKMLGKILNCIPTKSELSTSISFQVTTAQSWQFSSNFSVTILSVLQQKINF